MLNYSEILSQNSEVRNGTSRIRRYHKVEVNDFRDILMGQHTALLVKFGDTKNKETKRNHFGFKGTLQLKTKGNSFSFLL